MRRLLAQRERRHYKGSLIEPAIECLVTGMRTAKVRPLGGCVEGEVIWARNLVGPVAEATGVAQVARHAGRQRLTALGGGNSGQLPSTENCVHHAAHTCKKPPVTANGQLVQVTNGEAVTQIGHYWTVLQIWPIRILDKPANVSIGITQVLGKSVGSEEVQSICEAFIQRCLERVVEHLQLWKIKRQHGGHIRLLIEITPAVIREWAAEAIGGTAEVSIKDLRRLIEIARLVIP